MKYLLIVLLFFVPCYAVTTVNVTATHDAFADSTNQTFNYGGSTSYYVGNRSGTAECNMLIRFDLSSIPSNQTIYSATCSLWTPVINNADGWYVRFRMLDSAWVEGTANAAYQNGSSSWNNQGFGTACDGSTIAQADSCLGSCASTAVPPKGGAWSTAVIDSEIINSTSDSTIVVDLTSAVQQQVTSGVNYGYLLFGTSTVTSRRVTVACKDFTETAGLKRPKMTITYGPPPDSTFMRIAVTVPAGTVTRMPVLVSFYTYPNLADGNLTFYAVDSTTKLYWWPDSIGGHYTRAWVRGNWAGGTDTIFVSNEINPRYQDSDSVFLLYEDFQTPFEVSSLCDTLTEGDRVCRDTVNAGSPIINMLNNPFKWCRENSNICSTANGYVMVVCGGFSNVFDTNTDPQDSSFGCVFRSDGGDFRTWDNEGLIITTRSAPWPVEDTLRMQDPYLLLDGDTLRMLIEDKRLLQAPGSYDLIGQLTSVNNGLTWTYRGPIIDSLFWDSNNECSPSSPVIWKIGSRYFIAGEGKNGSYTEDGVAHATTGGAIYMATGTSIYSLTRFHPTEDGTDFELPAIPYASGYSYACVPDAHWVEGTTHYLSAHTQDFNGDSWGVTVWSISEADLVALNCNWVEVGSISRSTDFWGNSAITYRELASDPHPFKIDGNYWVLTSSTAQSAGADTSSTMNLCPVIDWDTTGNPYKLWYWNQEHYGARGFIQSSEGFLTIEMEPLSERASCGIMTQMEFDSNYICDVRYRLDYPNETMPYVNFTFGNDSLGPYDGTNYELTSLLDGYGFAFKPLANNTMGPYRQPSSGNRSDGTEFSAPTYSQSWNWFSFGMTQDTVWSGFGRSLSNTATGTAIDTLDELNNITVGAGSLQNSRYNGGRIALDVLQVRKYARGGFSTTAADTLYLSEYERDLSRARGTETKRWRTW